MGIFIRGPIAWDEDPEVSGNVVVVSFLPQSAANVAHHRPCTPGYRLHAGDDRFQLYNKNTGDTFVFISRGAQVSIALRKISATVQRVSIERLYVTYDEAQYFSFYQQLGRLLRQEIANIEIHVVSNRDRVAHQLFDLWFDQ